MVSKAIAIGSPIRATEYIVGIYLCNTRAMKSPIEEADKAVMLSGTFLRSISIFAVRLCLLLSI